MSTKNVQRKISATDLQFPGYLRAPMIAKPTAIGLWLHTDGLGRREVVPELIAAAIYPGEAATDMVLDHLLMLDEAGFLDFYRADGTEWLQLRRPLKVDARLAWSNCPTPPDREPSRTFAAVGGARERAGERVRAEQAARAGQWAAWADEHERTTQPPARPLLLDAPPIGCPEHPHGRFADCGPCGTARRRHDRWVQEARYGEQVTKHEQQSTREEEWDDGVF
ncbi:hypothetical protein PTQ19_07060 [Microbacterium esteraromaticum]|uniref:hypothetical protein n=1 Tax=Microbacterium esteraromaticum TaxID=57043 RepID=UPI0023674867|nr:hypothetical protein [Microbacterium esteraromaticum]WDH80182.1 hypothetical protein PTQ19_07060 [Microbacterium esteraromaticum]